MLITEQLFREEKGNLYVLADELLEKGKQWCLKQPNSDSLARP